MRARFVKKDTAEKRYDFVLPNSYRHRGEFDTEIEPCAPFQPGTASQKRVLHWSRRCDHDVNRSDPRGISGDLLGS